MSTAPESVYDIRDAWMAEGYAWHGLPARNVAKVPVKQPVRHRTKGDNSQHQRLYRLLKRNRWTEDPFLRFCTDRCGHSGKATSPM